MDYLQALEQWAETGEMTPEMALAIEYHLDDLIGTDLGEVDRLTQAQPDEALMVLTRLSSVISAVAGKRPAAVIGKLSKWYTRIKARVNALAIRLKADGFSIGVGLPVGLSISLNFVITHASGVQTP